VASLHDLAVLAVDVYSSAGGPSSSSNGWTRLDNVLWGDGFAAGRYRRGDDVIVAYRGTDDSNDAVSDARMVPLLKHGAANKTLETLLAHYGVGTSRTSIRAIKLLLVEFLESKRVQKVTTRLGNQVPPVQTKKALEFFDATSPCPEYVCGHSLGGALAKAVSDARTVAGVGFNSPYMGNMRGTIPMSSMNILSVNTVGDPLSLATQAAGNLPHGAVIPVTIPSLKKKKPATPDMVRRRHHCGWRKILLSGVGGYVTCRASAEFRYRKRQVGAEWTYLESLLEYIKAAALHYHSMTNLESSLATGSHYVQPLGAHFEGVLQM
jgi:hypothetical protein